MSAHRLALVGAGSMGSNHARVIAASSQAELAVVVDPDQDRGQAVAEAHGASWQPDLSDLSDVQGVVIAAATEHHGPLLDQVIAMGLPLLVEKPVCASLEDTVRALDASERAGVPMMCGLLERYNPAMMVALKMLEEPLFVRAERHSPYAPRIRTGVAWDLLVHDVDLVVQVFTGQDIARVSTEIGFFHPSSLPNAEDVVETTLRFGSGGLATVSASRIGQRKVRTLMIHELDRVLEVDLLRRGVTAYRHTTLEPSAQGGSGYRQSTEIEVPEVQGREPLVTQLDRFLDLIEGRVDADAERRSILPAHQVVDQLLTQAAGR